MAYDEHLSAPRRSYTGLQPTPCKRQRLGAPKDAQQAAADAWLLAFAKSAALPPHAMPRVAL